MEQTRQQLDEEKTKRQQSEKHVSAQKAEIIKLKDMNIKLDRELNKAWDNLKAREWEVKQLESRQNKAIVGQVHVLDRSASLTSSLWKCRQSFSREAGASSRARDRGICQYEERRTGLQRKHWLRNERRRQQRRFGPDAVR